MRIVQVPATDAVGCADEAVYRVRVWTPSAVPNAAWMVDEYDLYEALDVESVLSWAKRQSIDGTVEVFVSWTERAQARDGRWEDLKRFARIFGQPADEGGTTEIVPLNADDD